MALDSNLQSALARIRQGPVEVVFDPDSADVAIFAEGPVELNFERGLEEATIDHIGLYNMFTGGDGITFDLTVPELSNDVLAYIFPDGTSLASPYVGRGFGRAAGLSMRTYAKKVQIRPWQTRGDGDLQVILHAVIPAGPPTLSQGKTEPYRWTIPFRALPDATQADGTLVAQIFAPART